MKKFFLIVWFTFLSDQSYQDALIENPDLNYSYIGDCYEITDTEYCKYEVEDTREENNSLSD